MRQSCGTIVAACEKEMTTVEANVWPVGDVFNQGGDIQFILPRFQRPYAWEQTEWQALWDDLLDVHGAGAHASHFLGAIVVVNEEIRGTHVPTYTLIDGQQRLLTLSLLLHALLHKVTEQNDDYAECANISSIPMKRILCVTRFCLPSTMEIARPGWHWSRTNKAPAPAMRACLKPMVFPQANRTVNQPSGKLRPANCSIR